jgi:hypothetical protein
MNLDLKAWSQSLRAKLKREITLCSNTLFVQLTPLSNKLERFVHLWLIIIKAKAYPSEAPDHGNLQTPNN